MQGKYQLAVIANVGHILHEVCTLSIVALSHCSAYALQDDPERLAEVLVEFWRRNERITVNIKNLKKVGEP